MTDLQRAFSGSRVLVTGGAGFIGSHLVEALVAHGASVTALDNLRTGDWKNLASVASAVERLDGDVRDAAVVGRVLRAVQPRYVFHLAANASISGSVEDPAYDFEANTVGTFVVLNALRRNGACEKVVVVSSGAVYGEPQFFPIRETDPLRPISPYGASKLNTEVVARMFQGVYGVPVVLARLFNAYGPRMTQFVVLDFLRKLQADPVRLEILGTGQQRRDFTFVSDTVAGLLILAARGAPSEAYNLSSGSNCSILELASRLIEGVGLGDRTEIVFTGQSWIGDAQRWEVSLEKIQALGYRPAVALDEGLVRTRDWFVENYGPITS